MKRALAAVTLLALTLPSLAFAQSGAEEESKFDPSHEWDLTTWGPELKIGPIDMSINKAVAYLMLGTVCSILLGIVLMRVRPGRGPNRRQALGETIYEVAQVQVAEQGLPTKAIGRWFPYVATLMIFIWVINMLGFIPLPLSDETLGRRRGRAPDLRDLRRDLDAVGHARARPHDMGVHARRGDPRERRLWRTSRAGSRTCRRRCSR